MQRSTQDRLFITVLQILTVVIVLSAVLDSCKIGFDKEERRLEAVREHNCKYYGDAINDHYGKELCK